MANIYTDFQVLSGGICLQPHSNFENSTRSLWMKEYTKIICKQPGVRELTKYSIKCDILMTNRDYVSWGFIFGYRTAEENGGTTDSYYMLYFYTYQHNIYFKKQLNDGTVITIRTDYHSRYIYAHNAVYPTELVWIGDEGVIEWTIDNGPVFSIQDTTFSKGGWGFMTDWCNYKHYFVLDNLIVSDIG